VSRKNSPTQPHRECRYVLRHSPEVSVTLQPEDIRDAPETHRARLFDLSPRGAKLVSTESIALEKSIRLELNVADLGLVFYVSGQVCWSQPGDGDTCVFGCSLEPALPAGVFDALIEGGHIDRRFDPRSQRGLGLEAVWERGRKATPVTLQDYSRGGLRVRTNKPGTPGEPFPLRFPGPSDLTICTTAVWQLKVVDGYLIGCAFADPSDYSRLEQIIEAHADDAAVCR
jgi:hypothetical protein